jgi:hypothetical protein
MTDVSTRYLLLAREKVLSIGPQKGKSCEVYADVDFCGNWNRSTAVTNVSTAKYRIEYIISFAGFPITWASKLQTQIALSTTEEEYITLYQSLREVIPMINILMETNMLGMCSYTTASQMYCNIFEEHLGTGTGGTVASAADMDATEMTVPDNGSGLGPGLG